MKIVRSRTGWLSGLLAAVMVAGTAEAVSAQQTSMPSTLRYGSGYLDVPSATVIPHLAVLGTFSGFWVDTDAEYETGSNGQVIGLTQGRDEFMGDGSITLGLFDRIEVGTTLQSFNDDDMGGNMWGAFGRISLLKPRDQGIGLGGGVRYISGPSYTSLGDDALQPNRLGFPDPRFRSDLPDGKGEDVETDLTIYGVATGYFRGPSDTFLPEHDFTFSIGLGNGMFADGEKMEWYKYTDSEGLFAAASVAFELGDASLLHLMGEWNGFDLNVGAQLDFSGLRIGGHYLGANYLRDAGIYRSGKWGVLASLMVGGDDEGFLGRPRLMPRMGPDTVRLPAPPPDTVTVTREVAPPLPTGTPTNLCLATGEQVQVLVTAQGDTLVGPDRISIRTLRQGGVVFAGNYAAGRDWFVQDQPVTFEERQYLKSGGEVRLECPNLMQVGEYMGVPLFAMRSAERPFETLYVPVRPGIWQAYQTDLRRTRGQ